MPVFDGRFSAIIFLRGATPRYDAYIYQMPSRRVRTSGCSNHLTSPLLVITNMAINLYHRQEKASTSATDIYSRPPGRFTANMANDVMSVFYYAGRYYVTSKRSASFAVISELRA